MFWNFFLKFNLITSLDKGEKNDVPKTKEPNDLELAVATAAKRDAGLILSRRARSRRKSMDTC